MRTLRMSHELRVLKQIEDDLDPSCSRTLASLMLLRSCDPTGMGSIHEREHVCHRSCDH